MDYFFISRAEWNKTLEKLLDSHDIFAPLSSEFGMDYELLTPASIQDITYNKPKPITPLKLFFLPVKENVTDERKDDKKPIIIGVPACDIEALGILDEIYLDKNFEDIFYKKRRENTLIISSDCFDVVEHCHCTTYGVNPWAERIADLAVAVKDEQLFFRVISQKGRTFISDTVGASKVNDNSILSFIDVRHREIEGILQRTNKDLPSYKETRNIVSDLERPAWIKNSATCVSCGACTAICPTCTCFLLIDKPGFRKIKQLDACQYPGFERTAAGEDPLKELHERFKNRYLCKYVWKPERFNNIACTGCGRCIEACIGKINKNKIFVEMAK
ncbi:MAG TPA: 4Fe-4S dicluster domain-containing protein [Bacteroidales bacterium]|nr:4Fe-4S dicluster domain-containing protein [Bacteroidales bacterium]HOU95926.1 4Fe-4S dicluster domain-containing protein [Bacteroidales bacterium]HQG36852.1 4Fe-4S dicluster domain-containing protein [Bacteroidales bacterium]HQG52658.1 4Fe-4S dicluster domain-containing protein [Bacteroidales bacterium]HQJ20680.1 4Fe-4S dicluster domain-containing protein [Bacteroidales bacterium]